MRLSLLSKPDILLPALKKRGRVLSKSADAVLLKSMGFSYLEIARELYPSDYRRYREARDPGERARLRKLLVRRVWKLLRLGRVGPSSDNRWDPNDGGTLEFDDTGGERDRLAHRAPLAVEHPGKRKAGKRGYDRQLIEYEQFLKHVYDEVIGGEDPDYVIWSFAKALHHKAFHEYYSMYRANVWGPSTKREVPLAYAYFILMISSVMHGKFYLKPRLQAWFLERNPRALEKVQLVGPIIAQHII